VGLVSRSGIIPISASQDTAGPMTRTVADAAALLGVLASASAGDDDAAVAAAAYRLKDYTGALDAGALRGIRIGVLRKSGLEQQPDVEAAFERALAHMREAGAVLLDVEIPTSGRWNEPEFTVLKYEFKDGLERYLRAHDAPVKSLAELVAFNRAHAAEEMPFFGQELLEQTAALGTLDTAEYRKAARDAKRLAGPEGIDAALAKHDLDALIAPTTSPAWPIDPLNGDHFTGAGYGAAAAAGYPSLTVPMGDAHGLPLGITFMGPKWSEARLLGFGFAFEQRAQARKAPAYLPTLVLP
jgi:amidase